MASHSKKLIVNILTGLIVGFFWEGYGAIYLWDLANPKILMFGLAMIGWSILGAIILFILRKIEIWFPENTVFIKPLVGPLALVIAKVTNEIGIISFKPSVPLIFGVPPYMMIGMTILVYFLDDLIHRPKKPL